MKNINYIFFSRYFDDFEKKIPRTEITEIEQMLKKYIYELNEEYIITVCGSYRRGKETSGDIDVLITHPKYISEEKESKKKNGLLKNIVEYLEKKQLITDTMSLGPTKFMVHTLPFVLIRFSNDFLI